MLYSLMYCFPILCSSTPLYDSALYNSLWCNILHHILLHCTIFTVRYFFILVSYCVSEKCRETGLNCDRKSLEINFLFCYVSQMILRDSRICTNYRDIIECKIDFTILQSMGLYIWSKIKSTLIFNFTDIGFTLTKTPFKRLILVSQEKRPSMEISNDLHQYKLWNK